MSISKNRNRRTKENLSLLKNYIIYSYNYRYIKTSTADELVCTVVHVTLPQLS